MEPERNIPLPHIKRKNPDFSPNLFDNEKKQRRDHINTKEYINTVKLVGAFNRFINLDPYMKSLLVLRSDLKSDRIYTYMEEEEKKELYNELVYIIKFYMDNVSINKINDVKSTLNLSVSNLLKNVISKYLLNKYYILQEYMTDEFDLHITSFIREVICQTPLMYYYDLTSMSSEKKKFILESCNIIMRTRLRNSFFKNNTYFMQKLMFN